MTLEEAKSALEELKQDGNSEEDILKILYLMYVDGELEFSDFRTFNELMGYKLTDEFEAMSEEEKKTAGLKGNDKPAESVEDMKKRKRGEDCGDEEDNRNRGGITLEEAQKALEQLKNEGNSDEDILKVLYLMYCDGKMELSDLRAFTELLGYEFTDEFKEMPEDDKKTRGLKIDEDFFEKASLPDAADSFARFENIPVDIAMGLLNDGLKEGRSYSETIESFWKGDIMSFANAQNVVDNLKAEGKSNDEIYESIFKMFQCDELSLSNLRMVLAVLGYEFTDEFYALTLDEKKTKGRIIA